MQIFNLDPVGFNQLRKKMLLRAIPFGLLALAIGLFVPSVNKKADAPEFNVLPFVIPVALASMGLGIVKGLKRQKDQWDSYRLVIDGEVITRTQNSLPTVTIHKNDLREITMSRRGHLLLKAQQKRDIINIPSAVLDRDILLEALAGFGQITKQKESKIPWTPIASIALLVLWVLFFVTKERMIMVPAGIILIVGLLWSFVSIQKSKLVDEKTRRNSWFILLVLFSIVGRLLIELKVFGE